MIARYDTLLETSYYALEQIEKDMPMTILGFPYSSGLEPRHDYVRIRPRYVERILGIAVLDSP